MTIHSASSIYGHEPTSFYSQELIIKEDSLLTKCISCVPIIGSFVFSSVSISLMHKIQNSLRTRDIINLLEVKNSYTKIGIIRSFIELAGIVYSFSTRAFIGTSITGFLAVYAATNLIFIPICIYQLVHNTRVYHQLQQEKNERPFQPKSYRNFEIK